MSEGTTTAEATRNYTMLGLQGGWGYHRPLDSSGKIHQFGGGLVAGSKKCTVDDDGGGMSCVDSYGSFDYFQGDGVTSYSVSGGSMVSLYWNYFGLGFGAGTTLELQEVGGDTQWRLSPYGQLDIKFPFLQGEDFGGEVAIMNRCNFFALNGNGSLDWFANFTIQAGAIIYF